MQCPYCRLDITEDSKFCKECGNQVTAIAGMAEADTAREGERKQVTVLFSDLSGYTALCEKIEPEEVKEITSRLFGQIANIVTRYDGSIDKYIGDAVMATFGAAKAYEDDPVRAIRACREIHLFVESLSPEYEKIIHQPLAMHSGINTGLVATGEVDIEQGILGITGSAVNLAARLSDLSRAGEILVGPGTHVQVEGYFNFKDLGPIQFKGRSETTCVYKLLAPKRQPYKVRRIHGLRSELIGRQVELTLLKEAVRTLKEGQGSILSVCGPAGTGKSRLLEEFKASLNLEKIQWREGHAYPYGQNIPYFAVINMLGRAFQIEEGDSKQTIQSKIESGMETLVGQGAACTPYIGGLFDLSYPELEHISPDSWKSHLQAAIQDILAALAQQAPTVICIEDLHWADPSSLDLLRLILSQYRLPVLFVVTYRPAIDFFSDHMVSTLQEPYKEIRLQDLSPIEMQEMLKSLLRTPAIPHDLEKFVQGMIDGNPFYLEEVINSLIESETLIRRDGGWVVNGVISKHIVSPSINGVISARLDRLGKEDKRILQEASVIGRTFPYEILKRISQISDHIDGCLKGLEQQDLIRTQSLIPDLEYGFKHALTQEVVYNGLFKKERKAIHEQIGLVMERLFAGRLSEFYETLAFHFLHGLSVPKAVNYLIKSGEKSLAKYALEESHRYFQQAFELIRDDAHRKQSDNEILIDIINRWALVYYYRGDFKGLEELIRAHMNVAETITSKASLGTFYSWFGSTLFQRERIDESYQYLKKALALGEQIENRLVICQASTWLSWTCADFGLFEEGLQHGRRAQTLFERLDPNPLFYFLSLGGISFNYFYLGDGRKNYEVGRTLLAFGERHTISRSQVVGHISIGHSHWAAGNLAAAIDCYRRAEEVAKDPLYQQWSGLFFGMCSVQNAQYNEAEPFLGKVVDYGATWGCESIGSPAALFLGLLMIRKGRMKQGLAMIHQKLQSCKQNKRVFGIAWVEFILGRVFFNLATRGEPLPVADLVKNFAFLFHHLPRAEKLAMGHYDNAIEVSKRIGASGVLGQAYLDLGMLHRLKKRADRARECLVKAARIFEQCGADIYLQQVQENLNALKP